LGCLAAPVRRIDLSVAWGIESLRFPRADDRAPGARVRWDQE